MKKKLLTGIICFIIAVAILLTGCTENNANNIITNSAPVAGSDYAVVEKNSNNTLINVLNNDNDSDGDTLTILSASNPANGNINISFGYIYYTPNQNFSLRQPRPDRRAS